MFSSCSSVVALASVVDNPEKDWAEKAHLKKLINHPKKQLLTENEKLRASKNICALKHLDKNKVLLKESAIKFCKLAQNDKIYFYDLCMDCGHGHYVETSYLLVREDKPFKSVQIEMKWSDELGRSVPIIERVH